MYNIKKELEKFNEILNSLDQEETPAESASEEELPSRVDRPAKPSARLDATSNRAANVSNASPADRAALAGSHGANADRTGPSAEAQNPENKQTGTPTDTRYGVFNGPATHKAPKKVIEKPTSKSAGPNADDRSVARDRTPSYMLPPTSAIEPLTPMSSPPPPAPKKRDDYRAAKAPWNTATPNRGGSTSSTPPSNRGGSSSSTPPGHRGVSNSSTPQAKGAAPQKRKPIVPIPPNPLVPTRPSSSSASDEASLRKVRLPENRSARPSNPEDRHRDLDALIDDLRGSLSRPATLRDANPIVKARTIDTSSRRPITIEPIKRAKRRPALTLVAAAVALVVPALLAGVLVFSNSSNRDAAEFASSATISSGDQPSLSVTTEPRGAKIYLNNELVGVTPFENVKVSAGDYLMTTELDGFVQSDTILSIRGTSSLAFALNASDNQAGFAGDDTGHILAGLESDIPDESLVQTEEGNDASTTQTPVEAESNAARSESAPQEARTEPVERTPRVTRGAFSLTSEPSGATVWLNDEAIGETPITLKDIRSGDHTIKFMRPNYETFETEVSVIAGIVTPFHASLEPVLGSIVVTVQPVGEVYIDGELVGRGVTGLSRFEVTPGSHTVRVENPTYGVKDLSVEVRPSRSAELTVNFVDEGVDQLVAQGDDLFGSGEFAAAREIYLQAAALAPSNALVTAKLSEIDRLIDAQREQEATEAIIENGVYLVVDTPPQLIGGLEALHKTVRYPEAAYKAGVEGRVFVQFVVDEEGNPSDLKISRGLPLGCDEAAMDAVSKAKFIPGEFKGRKVKVRHTLFINFRK